MQKHFPPFSVGETGRFGGQNRREVSDGGHGALAEKSIVPVIPDLEDFLGFKRAMRISSYHLVAPKLNGGFLHAQGVGL
jgi:polyribonucleotide nucleotidyltransferase